MIVVFDSDVLIPLILDASRSTRIFHRLRAGGHQMATSQAILDEVREKMLTKERLRRWLDVPEERIREFLDLLPEVCVVYPDLFNAHGSVPTDPKDEKIIATAMESKADYILSEDKHLRDIQVYEGIPIMNREEFLIELDRLGVPNVDQ